MRDIFDDWADFNRDGDVDDFEKIMALDMIDEGLNSHEDESDDEEEMRDEIELAGLDYDELSDMDEEERNEALEEAGLDPDDYDFDMATYISGSPIGYSNHKSYSTSSSNYSSKAKSAETEDSQKIMKDARDECIYLKYALGQDKENERRGKTASLIGVFALVALILIAIDPLSITKQKCSEPNCDRYAEEGSDYCTYHAPTLHTTPGSGSSSMSGSSLSNSSSNSSSKSYSSPSSTSSSSSSKKSSSGSSSKKSTSKAKDDYEDTYDEGYDDIYMDGDYDSERYNTDSEYASGVDDAMEDTYEEYGEEW